jgi:hypothetical protein
MLKSGGPPMTVVDDVVGAFVRLGEPDLIATWFDKQHRSQTGRFQLASLRMIGSEGSGRQS